MEEKLQWPWMMAWCKTRGYPAAQTWAWDHAEKAWGDRQKYLDKIRADHSCWYCQLGLGSGGLGLRDVPEPPNWKDTLCEHHLDSLTPVHEDGEKVACEICGKEYEYRPWNKLVGREDKRCFCGKCVSRFQSQHLDDDRLVEGKPDELDHLTNIEKSHGVRDI